MAEEGKIKCIYYVYIYSISIYAVYTSCMRARVWQALTRVTTPTNSTPRRIPSYFLLTSTSFVFLTFPILPCRVFLTCLPRLPCHFDHVVITHRTATRLGNVGQLALRKFINTNDSFKRGIGILVMRHISTRIF